MEIIYSDSLPQILSDTEMKELLIKMKQGDVFAREKLIYHNLRLVAYRVNRKFCAVEINQEDLMQIGIIGLIKAIDTFDIEKNLKISTYATKCIDTEILMFIRKNQRHQNVEKLERILRMNEDGSEATYEDFLSSDVDLEESYIDREVNLAIRKIVETLPVREKQMIKTYFGFDNNQTHTIREIADKFNISKSQASRIIKKTLKQIAQVLENSEVVEKGSITMTKIRCRRGK